MVLVVWNQSFWLRGWCASLLPPHSLRKIVQPSKQTLCWRQGFSFPNSKTSYPHPSPKQFSILENKWKAVSNLSWWISKTVDLPCFKEVELVLSTINFTELIHNWPYSLRCRDPPVIQSEWELLKAQPELIAEQLDRGSKRTEIGTNYLINVFVFLSFWLLLVFFFQP